MGTRLIRDRQFILVMVTISTGPLARFNHGIGVQFQGDSVSALGIGAWLDSS